MLKINVKDLKYKTSLPGQPSSYECLKVQLRENNTISIHHIMRTQAQHSEVVNNNSKLWWDIRYKTIICLVDYTRKNRAKKRTCKAKWLNAVLTRLNCSEVHLQPSCLEYLLQILHNMNRLLDNYLRTFRQLLLMHCI